MEMRWYRRILRISYKDYLTNEEVFAKIQQAIGPIEDLLTIVKGRKLKSYEHVFRSSGLARTILQRAINGGRRQGRQKKRGGKTTSGNGQARSSPSPRGQWRTEENGCEIICGAPTTPAEDIPVHAPGHVCLTAHPLFPALSAW